MEFDTKVGIYHDCCVPAIIHTNDKASDVVPVSVNKRLQIKRGRKTKSVQQKRKVGSSNSGNTMVFMTYIDEHTLTDEQYEYTFVKQYGIDPVRVGGKTLRHVTDLSIVNNVVTATLKRPVDLQILKETFAHMGAEYSSKKKFPSLGLHFACDGHGQRAAINVFSTGKIVCPGCPTIHGAMQSIMKVVNMIEQKIPGVVPADVIVRNIVGCVRLDVGIDLSTLHCFIKTKLGGDPVFRPPTYESEDFPGLQWMDNNNRMFLIFTSGAIVITNGRTTLDILKGATYIHSVLYNCWKENPTTLHVLKDK
jgi:TATA-box binding protein (TBP) (component of TFIID and TFIIIB)